MPKFTNFKLTEADRPFLDTLKFTSEAQYHVLLRAQQEQRLSYEQIAADLQIPLNTVKTRLHRAREKITKWRAKAEAEAFNHALNTYS